VAKEIAADVVWRGTKKSVEENEIKGGQDGEDFHGIGSRSGLPP
jgi:hypothetical protein